MSEKQKFKASDMPVIRAHVPQEMKDAFFKECQENYESESSVVRRLIREYLKKD